MAHTARIKHNGRQDRVIMLVDGARYIVRIIEPENERLSMEAVERTIDAVSKLLAGESNICVVNVDFEIIQVVNG